MMRNILIYLGIAVAASGTPAGAQAAVLVRDDGSSARPRYIRWAEQARTQLPNDTITVNDGDCIHFAGYSCAVVGSTRIYIHTDHHPHDARRAFYHELGHVFDFGMRVEDREWFRRSFFAKNRTWLSVKIHPQDTPMEWFGDLYAACAIYGVNHPHLNGWIQLDGYGFPPMSRVKYQRTCRYLRYTAQYVGISSRWPLA